MTVALYQVLAALAALAVVAVVAHTQGLPLALRVQLTLAAAAAGLVVLVVAQVAPAL
jgi:hypothetical protein